MSATCLSTPERSPDCSFPLEVLLPKKETQQETFLKAHPEYDGRGIIIAILDTGVDPAMPGMQTTTTGERKMIDCVDCSGAGDVDTSTVKTAVDGVVTGLTGRELKIPDSWKNPSGKWHLGVKPIYELYTKTLKTTVTKEKKKELWESAHQMALADTQRKMTRNEDSLGGFSDKLSDMLEREDLACQLDFLKKADKFEDNGPVADVLAWNDGTQWLACIDTSFRGRLNMCTPMASFRSSGQYGKLSDRDEATYTFRIDSKNGNWVEICVASGSHGSHVANIAAANFPDEPKKNGLAPGAKVVSFCIGDNRLGAMETGTALTRAFNLCAEYGVHVANLSFGEGTHLPNKGRIIAELKKLIAEKNVVFMISGGNNGPALTTVGAPGGTTSGVIGVGAYLTPEMADPLYGVSSEIKGNLYPWSSRGPATDGWLGISICAPGAALTGVPRYCRQGAQMMNGTSMSSPNAAGAVACILSALLANKQSWTAYQIRVALENSAKQTENPEKFSQGQGMIQIADTFEYLRNSGEFLPATLRDFRVQCSDGTKTTRGIYLREDYDTKDIKEFTVNVQPRFKNYSDLDHHIEFEKHFVLKATESWIKCPECFVATGGNRSFFLHVDPRKVPVGQAVYGEVQAFDNKATHLGPLFRVPITVIRAEQADESASKEFNFDAHSGCPVRRFVTAPHGATVAEVKVTSLSKIPGDRFLLHKVNLIEDTCYRNTESYKVSNRRIALGPDHDEWVKYLPVKGGRTVEFCLARAWSRGTEKPAKIRMEIKFHGVTRPEEIHLTHEAGSAQFLANVAPFRPVEINPSAQLKTLVIPLKQSSSARLEPLGPQDVFIPGIQINRLLLTYKLNLTKGAEVAFELPGLSQYLYESPIDCLRFLVFNATKGYEGSASSFPDRLEKGEHLIQAQIRHPDESFLETLRDVPLHVSIKVPSPITLDVYKEPVGAAKRGGNKWSKKVLFPGQQFALYFGSLNDDKLFKPVTLTAGAYLKGELRMFEENELKMAERTSVYYHFTEYSTRSPKGPSMIVLKEKEAKKEQKQEMEDAMRDLKISWLEKLKDETEATQLYTDLLQQHPNHLPLLTVRMKQLLGKNTRSQAETDTLELIFQQILEICKPEEVQRFFGCRQEQNEETISLKKTMEERKAAIIDVLLAKATLLVDSHLSVSTLEIPKIFKNDLYGVIELKAAKELSEEEVKKITEKGTSHATRAAVDTAYTEVLKYIAPDDSKCLILSAKHAIAHGHSGRAVKYLWKAVEDGRGENKDTGLAEKAVAEICYNLGWVHISILLKNDYLVRHPSKHRMFQAHL